MDTFLGIVCGVLLAICGAYLAALLFGVLTGHIDPATIHFM